jgi:RNA polymerase sigma factor (sigma-70 family)
MRHSGAAATATNEAKEHGVGSADAVGRYLDQIGHHHLLDREREAGLGRAVQAGNQAADVLADGSPLDPAEQRRLDRQVRRAASARQQLVESNLRLVVSIAKHYQHRGVDLADLIQEGNLGLIKAVERFDPDLGYRFSTYATWWIRQAVSRAVDNTGSSVRLPVHARSMVRELRTAEDHVGQVLGRAPTGAELAQETGIDPKAAAAVLAADQPALSLSAPVGDGGLELGEVLRSGADGPDSVATAHAFHAQLDALVGQLPAVEQKVLTVRFGLDGRPPGTLSDVAEELGVSRQRARQIETRALRRLRRRPELARLAARAA